MKKKTAQHRPNRPDHHPIHLTTKEPTEAPQEAHTAHLGIFPDQFHCAPPLLATRARNLPHSQT